MPLESIRFDRPLRDVRLVIAGDSDAASREEAARARLEEIEREQAAAVAAAREQGYRQGRADADASFTEQLMAQRQEVLALAEGVLRRLGEQEATLAAQAKGCVPGLVMSIVRRVLAGCAPDPARIERIIEQALAEAPSNEDQPLEVNLSPADFASLEGVGGDALRSHHPRITLRPDTTLAPNDCLVRGNFGLIDARLETKLKTVEHLLATS